ncbi:hypothetical protein RhiirA4_463139 [Rhizophagus irregularis]|uniref:Uncharacterized protein n=1 Tax=Rhizophagus irregularis TaxID=588596 RepID=A0A2I1GMB1_9GLOM|nr:hypothetical protein RhiirA4_463139 [Rhizophagus irregularis]
MNPNNQNVQDYPNLPMDNSNEQHIEHNPINDVGAFINSATPAKCETSINLSHIPDPQFPLHNNIHSLIQQQIQQLIQLLVYQQNTANNIQQQLLLFETIQPTTQVFSNNNTFDTTSISVNGTISDNIQDEEFQNSP